jgi:hypothetical protein
MIVPPRPGCITQAALFRQATNDELDGHELIVDSTCLPRYERSWFRAALRVTHATRRRGSLLSRPSLTDLFRSIC